MKSPANPSATASHWVDPSGDGDTNDAGERERDYSVAYTRHTKPKIAALFKVSWVAE